MPGFFPGWCESLQSDEPATGSAVIAVRCLGRGGMGEGVEAIGHDSLGIMMVRLPTGRRQRRRARE